MHKSNEDCFYFLTSSCAKGSSCTYRHSPLALTCNVVCPSWLRGNCLDPACPFRHSTTVQRPMVSNGILCFYENTPTGCLKVDCTFIHSRPRLNSRNTSTIRPSSTNLVKKDATKPIIPNTPSTDIPQTVQTSSSNINSPQPTINETQSITPITTLESSSNSDRSSPIIKTETITRRIAVPADTEQSTEKKNLSDNNNNNSSLTKSTTRSVINDSLKRNQEEITTNQSRLVANRNVVIGESTSIPSRKIVQTTPSSSNRVVVSSDSVNLPSKEKRNDIDLVEQENDTKKFKKDSQSTVDISFPCSKPSITNRLLLMSSKETTSTNDAKPIRLNRDRLPATNKSSGNSPISISTPTNEEKISAGTGLSQDDERRTMRIERFQKKPISPPRSVINSSSITTTNNITINSSTTRNVITSSPNERKRTAPETTRKDVPPSKRISIPSSSSQHQSSSRQTTSSLSVSTNSPSSSSSRDKNLEKQVDESIGKTAQRENPSSTIMVSPQSVSPSSVRPRFMPQPIVPPPLQHSPSSTTIRTPRPRQLPSMVIKQPLVPVMAPSQTSTKPIEQILSNINENNAPPPSPKSTVEHQTSNTPNEEDETQLLKLNEPTDVVDTFALIDEALLEADHLLELI